MKYSSKNIPFLVMITSIITYAQNIKGIHKDNKPNIIFICIDDLNDWVGCLKGHPQTITPNIDKLASQGTLFANAHCQAPICGPSRASVMTGLYPHISGNYLQLKDRNIKKSNGITQTVTLLPDYFEKHGYKSMAVGKIYHQGDAANTFDEYGGYFDKVGPKPEQRFNYDPKWFEDKIGNTQTDWGAYPDVDSKMSDYKSASWAIEKLNQNHDKPFFMAIGFYRPHVPWYVPQKWFDQFPLDSIKTPPYLKTDMNDIPKMGQHVSEAPQMPTTEWMKKNKQWKKAIQAYLASINFVDFQIGRVLKTLEKSKYNNNTIVVLWSDQGYQLGEKNRIAKQALWQRITHCILIIKPLYAKTKQVCKQPVQLIDIYPTLLDLSKLPKNLLNNGHSLKPLLEQPSSEWIYPAITSYGRGNISIITNHYQLIQYEDQSMEFYDLKNDPNEWINLVNKPEYKKLIEVQKKLIPEKQEDQSIHCYHTFNKYFKNLSFR